MDSQSLFNQLQDIINQKNQYVPVSSGDVYSDLLKRVNNFAPQIKEARGYEGQAYAAAPALMDQFNQDYGAVGGPDATHRLASILSTIGGVQGTSKAVNDVINTEGGNLNTLTGNILDLYKTAGQNLSDKYNMTLPLYQSAVSQEENARSRAAAASASDYSGLFGDLGGDMNGTTNTTEDPGIVPVEAAPGTDLWRSFAGAATGAAKAGDRILNSNPALRDINYEITKNIASTPFGNDLYKRTVDFTNWAGGLKQSGGYVTPGATTQTKKRQTSGAY